MITGQSDLEDTVATLRARLAEAEDMLRAIRQGEIDALVVHDRRTKDDFLAMLGHELRTPLSAISSAVRVLQLTDCQGERATRAHEVIARQVTHVKQLVNDLLDVERV